MEIVAIATLAAAGYLLNRKKAVLRPLRPDLVLRAPPPGDVSSFDDPYESRRYDQTRHIEYAAATDSMMRSRHPETTGVISRTYVDDRASQEQLQMRLQPPPVYGQAGGVSGLSGLQTDYSHTNMVPFFGGSVRQNVDPQGNGTTLERFTGTSAGGEVPRPAKQEILGTMFAPQPNMGNVYGAPPVDTDRLREYLPTLKSHKNTLPFEQERVGPAIDAGYGTEPSDGYMTGRKFQMPLDTDQLRRIDNPKISYEGRTIAGGDRIGARGDLGVVDGPRKPQRFKETFGTDDWLRTTGANLGETNRPEEILRDVTRPCTSVAYTGNAAPRPGSSASYADQGVPQGPVFRQDVVSLPVGIATTAYSGSGCKDAELDDHGRRGILVYSNNRDTTTAVAHLGTYTSVVKSIVAPLLDVVRPARRQVLGTFAPRAFGNASVVAPERQTVRDPDGVLRTTIRETVQNFSDNPGAAANFTGPRRLPVYDPTDVARTTMREQSIHDGAGPSAHTVAAPLDRRTAWRDPDDATRVTGRETLDETNTSVNPKPGGPSRGEYRDPDDLVRTTVRQTTSMARQAETDGTAVGGLQHSKGGYTATEFDARTTVRQETQYDGRYGGAATSVMTGGDAYRVNQEASVPRDTQRQVLSDHSHYGPGRQQGGGDAPSSHEGFDNATTRPDKEILATISRGDFGPSGTKQSVGLDDIDAPDVRRQELDCGVEARVPGIGRVYQNPAETATVGTSGMDDAGGGGICGIPSGPPGSEPPLATRTSRGTYGFDGRQADTRFSEDIVAQRAARGANPVASAGFFA